MRVHKTVAETGNKFLFKPAGNILKYSDEENATFDKLVTKKKKKKSVTISHHCLILFNHHSPMPLYIISFQTEQESWATGEEDHVVARAEFDFEAGGTNEISFRSGAMLMLAPKGKTCVV